MTNTGIQHWIESLSQREAEILRLISDGLSNSEIAQQLHLSLNTIKWYNKQLFSKLAVSRRTEAVKVARQHGLLTLEAGAQPLEQTHSLNNLPAQWTSYVGRKKEIADIQKLLAQSRLVVLTGAGGAGKTRLALQVAKQLLPRYRHGVWLVELASLSDPELVLDSIARVLKVKTNGDMVLIETLKKNLGRKQLLLLLDNFEHLLEAAPLVTDLLAAASQLTVLATSRERLHLYGEVEYRLSPLALPDLGTAESTQELLTYEAVDLFIQRARAAKPDLEVNDANVSAAVRICERLDGLPLAIELAASQAKVYPLAHLAQLLKHSLDALAEGPRDLPARQRTLRATIEWSTNLLKGDEKRLFACLAVFRGGAVLDDIQTICTPGLAGNVLDALTSLVDKSLIFVREGLEGEPRFTMLDTIREFATELLLATGEAETVRKLHAASFAGLAQQSGHEIRSRRHLYWYIRLRAEHENLTSALAWSLTGPEPNYGLLTVAALMDYWYYEGTMEDVRWADLAIERAENVPLDLRAAVLASAGTLFHNLGDMVRVRDLHGQAAELFKQLGDERNAAWSLMFMSIATSENPDEFENCLSMAQQSVETLRRLEDKAGTARALNALGELHRMKGDYESAESCYIESLALSRETGERIRQAVPYGNLGFVAFHRGQHQMAVNYIRRSLAIVAELGIVPGLWTTLLSLAGPMAAMGQTSEAARLIGAAEFQMEIAGATLQPPDRQEVLDIVESVRQSLSEKEYQRAWQAGYAMTTQQAIALALKITL